MFKYLAVRCFFFKGLKKIFFPIIICSLHQLAKNDLLGIYYVQISVKVKVTQSCPTLCNLWTTQSIEFFRPEYWSG